MVTCSGWLPLQQVRELSGVGQDQRLTPASVGGEPGAVGFPLRIGLSRLQHAPIGEVPDQPLVAVEDRVRQVSAFQLSCPTARSAVS